MQYLVTYRAVYTVRFAKAIYVLHVFQKKAVTTPAEAARATVAAEGKMILALWRRAS